MATHGLDTSLLVFAISLIIGGIAIYYGAKFTFKSDDFAHALITALLGAIAWALVDLAFGEIGIEGIVASLVGLIVWIYVIRWRYKVGWIRGAVLGLFAWVAAVLVISILSLLGIGGLEAYGVPGA